MLGKRFRLKAKDRYGHDPAVYLAMPTKKVINITIGQGAEQIDVYVSASDFLSALFELKNGKPFVGKHATKHSEASADD